jgi:hypothetical protein
LYSPNSRPAAGSTAQHGWQQQPPSWMELPLGMMSEDVELRQLMEGIAEAGSWAVWMGVFSKSWMKLLVAGGLAFKRARIVAGKISAIITECRCAVASRRFVMSGRPRKAQRRQNGDKNNWKRMCVSTMSVMGDRWAAGGSNRLTNSWRVVLHINDAMCAGASG